MAGALLLAACGPRDRDASDYLYDARSAAMFYCDPSGGPGDLDPCHDLVGGDRR